MGVAASSSSVIKLRAGVEVVDASAEVTYVLPVTAIDYIALQVTAELDSTNKNPYVSDTAVFVDAKVISFTKALADSGFITPTDSLAHKTDKAVTDSVSLVETFSKLLTYIRTYSETLDISEVLTLDLAKVLYDTAAATDAATREIAKLIPDGVAMNDEADTTDGLLVLFTKAFTNMAFVADAKTVDFVKAVTDSVSPADTLASLFAKALSDTVLFADAASLGFDLAKADSVSTTELIAIALIVGRSLADSVTMGDSTSLAPNKALSDSASVDDAGSLISQGYCDITYFAEDYVGESRTFT